MTKIDEFLSGAIGSYTIMSQSTFKHTQNGQFIIIGRSSRPNRPCNVLLWHNPKTGKREFVSSLFYVTDNQYCFDDRKGGAYKLLIDKSSGVAEVVSCKECVGIIHRWFQSQKI